MVYICFSYFGYHGYDTCISEVFPVNGFKRMQVHNFSTPRLYSQWLNPVIYWLIITARTGHGLA